MLSLLSLLTNTLPGPSASEVTTLWRYTNLFIIIIIITNLPHRYGNSHAIWDHTSQRSQTFLPLAPAETGEYDYE